MSKKLTQNFMGEEMSIEDIALKQWRKKQKYARPCKISLLLSKMEQAESPRTPTLKSKHRLNVSKTQRKIPPATNKLDSKLLVRAAKIYFRRNPTCLKKNADLQIYKQMSSQLLERHVSYRRESFISTPLDMQ